jgi:hypothetical protein
MPPAYVKPYVKRQKNDMADAEAICEAVTRANMRFVPTKTPEQQSCLMLHRKHPVKALGGRFREPRSTSSSGLGGDAVRAPIPGQQFMDALGRMIRQSG